MNYQEILQKIIKLTMKYEQFICFAIVGCSNLIISLSMYYVLLYLKIHYQIANIIGFVVGSLNGYIWNKNWVFKQKDMRVDALIKFYSTYIGSWILGAILLWLEVEILNISKWLVPFINILITTPINYVLNKHWTFKSKENSND